MYFTSELTAKQCVNAFSRDADEGLLLIVIHYKLPLTWYKEQKSVEGGGFTLEAAVHVLCETKSQLILTSVLKLTYAFILHDVRKVGKVTYITELREPKLFEPKP